MVWAVIAHYRPDNLLLVQLHVSKPIIVRWIGVPLFVVGGSSLVLTLILGAPSFWYVPCFCALVVIGFLWSWKPRLAASLSIGPLVALAALLRYLSGVWLGVAVLCFVGALLLVFAAIDNIRGLRVPLLLSLGFLGASFATDRLFTNRVTVRAYQMSVALDGSAPWGKVGPQWADGSEPIVLYRRVGSYCYDAFQSQELHDKLASNNGGTVEVEYNIFTDFGSEHAYNVRSIDGLLLNDGKHTIRDAERFGGQVLGSEAGSSDSCW